MFSDITDLMSACARENFKKGDQFCYSKSVTFDSCFVIRINLVKHERSVCGNVVYVFIIIRENITAIYWEDSTLRQFFGIDIFLNT